MEEVSDFLLSCNLNGLENTVYSVQGYLDAGLVEVQAIDEEAYEVEKDCGHTEIEWDYSSRTEVLELGTDAVREEINKLLEEFQDVETDEDFRDTRKGFVNVRVNSGDSHFEVFKSLDEVSIVGYTPAEICRERMKHYIEQTNLV